MLARDSQHDAKPQSRPSGQTEPREDEDEAADAPKSGKRRRSHAAVTETAADEATSAEDASRPTPPGPVAARPEQHPLPADVHLTARGLLGGWRREAQAGALFLLAFLVWMQAWR